MKDGKEMIEEQLIETATISAPASLVWHCLTEPHLMRVWMGDCRLKISGDWNTGSTIEMKGDLHGIKYTNKAIVLKVIRHTFLEYRFWTSLSRLSDQEEDYSVLRFELTHDDGTTSLRLIQKGFPTKDLYAHYQFYWTTVLFLIKKLSEITYGAKEESNRHLPYFLSFQAFCKVL